MNHKDYNNPGHLRAGLSFRWAPLAAIIVAGGLSLVSCRQKEDYSKRAYALDLYEKSCSLISRFTDSIRLSPDSARLLAHAASFEDKLTKLNYKYPADTYLEMTEGENDTLARLTARYIDLRDSLLYRYAHPLVMAPDSAGQATPPSHTGHNQN